MTRIKTGAGWGESKDDGPKHSLTLYNFDVDWAELKEEHKKHLRLRAVPLLQADPTRIAWVTVWQNPIGPPVPGPPADLDLMVYYDEDNPLSNRSDFYNREVATEEDVKALIATVRLKLTDI